MAALAQVWCPLAMFVKLPIHEITLLNSSGRSHATVNAQMPPLLAPRDRPAGRVVAQLHGLLDFRKNLFQQEPRVLIRQRVVFEAAIGSAAVRSAGLDEDADGDRHVSLRDQIVEDGRHVVLRPGAVLKDHHRRRILRRDIAPARKPTNRASCRRRSCSPTAASVSPCPSARRDARGCRDAFLTPRAAPAEPAIAGFVVPV